LAVAAVAAARRTAPSIAAAIWARPLLWAGAALAVFAGARMWNGPFGWRIGPVPLPPFAPFRVMTAAAVAALVGLVLSRSFRAAWTRRDPVVFYAAAAAVFWLLTLGPQPEWSANRRAVVYGPYYLLASLPGFDSLRVPARAWLPVTMCLAVLVSYAAARFTRRTWVVVAASLILAEGWFRDDAVAAPAPMPPGIIPRGAIVLELPMTPPFLNAVPQYRALLGGYRTINGYSGYEPEHFTAIARAMADPPINALNPYRVFGDLYVVVRPPVPPEVVEWLMGHPGLVVVRDDAGMRVVRVPAMSDPPRPPVPLPLPRPGTRPFGPR
jgi:hypothetical protein